MSTRKVCFKCNVEKSIDDFYVHKAMTDGHLGKCKECTRKDVKKHRELNIKKIREYDVKRAKTEKRIRLSAKVSSRLKKSRKDIVSAHNAVVRAVKSGKLKRESCEVCGSNRMVQAHHDDYSKKLSVRWLCVLCHRKHHVNHPAYRISGSIKKDEEKVISG